MIAQRQRTALRQEQALLVARAHEEERGWVASELHDDVLQRIALVRAEVESLWSAPEPRSAAPIEDRLRGINAELVDLAVAVRRIAARLHPTIVDQVGLVASLAALVEEVERGSDLRIDVLTDGPLDDVSPETARAVYRMVQESLRNAVRHSSGRSARITLAVGPRHLDLCITDDGRGFDPARVRLGGLGIANLRERAAVAGGTVAIRSKPGHGTSVEIQLPLAPPSPALGPP